MKKDKPQFAFIVHSRDRTDLPRVFPLVQFLPNPAFDFLTLSLPPFQISTITGLIDANGKEISGMMIGIPMTAHQLLEDRNKALKKIIQSVQLAENRGAKYIGLGAMTASLSEGGKALSAHVKHAHVTTGRTYTVKNIVAYVEFCTERFHFDQRAVQIAIVGAAGGIGFGVATELARRGYKNFLLIDLERKLNRVRSRMEEIHRGQDLNIEINHQLNTLVSAEIIIAATSSPEVIIESKDIAAGTIIINDAQPSDISPDIINNRDDVLVIEGGVLHTEKINCHLHLGLAQKNDIFSCLAEVLLLAGSNFQGNHLLHESDPSLYPHFEKESKRLNFSLSPQNITGFLDEEKLEQFSYIIRARHA